MRLHEGEPGYCSEAYDCILAMKLVTKSVVPFLEFCLLLPCQHYATNWFNSFFVSERILGCVISQGSPSPQHGENKKNNTVIPQTDIAIDLHQLGIVGKFWIVFPLFAWWSYRNRDNVTSDGVCTNIRVFLHLCSTSLWCCSVTHFYFNQ